MADRIQSIAEAVPQLVAYLYDVISDTFEYVGEFVRSPRVHRNIVRAILIFLTGGIQIGLAVIAYLVFYNRFLPDQVTQFPLYLQYGYGENPFALASLGSQNLKSEQEYDISVTLALPPSPANREMGNFMVTVHILGSPDGEPTGSPIHPDRPSRDQLLQTTETLATYRRPLLVPYADPLISLASRLLFLPFHVLRRTPKEDIVLDLMVQENAPFGLTGSMPRFILLEIEAGQTLQVYSTSITLTAQLNGLRWIMHHYWMSSFVVLTSVFWAVEIFWTILAWVLLSSLLGGWRRGRDQEHMGKKCYRPSPDSGGGTGKQPKIEPAIKHEEFEDGESGDGSTASVPSNGGTDDARMAHTSSSFREGAEELRRRRS